MEEIRKGKQKEKFTSHINTDDFYNYYALTYFKYFKEGRKNGTINKDSKFYMNRGLHSSILASFNTRIRDKIILENFNYIMPYRLGELRISKKKAISYVGVNGEIKNVYPIDFKATNDLWRQDPQAKKEKRIIKHLNKHTRGYVMRWQYSLRKAVFKNKSAYSFIPCRTAKLLTKEAILNEDLKIDYFLK